MQVACGGNRGDVYKLESKITSYRGFDQKVYEYQTYERRYMCIM